MLISVEVQDGADLFVNLGMMTIISLLYIAIFTTLISLTLMFVMRKKDVLVISIILLVLFVFYLLAVKLYSINFVNIWYDKVFISFLTIAVSNFLILKSKEKKRNKFVNILVYLGGYLLSASLCIVLLRPIEMFGLKKIDQVHLLGNGLKVIQTGNRYGFMDYGTRFVIVQDIVSYGLLQRIETVIDQPTLYYGNRVEALKLENQNLIIEYFDADNSLIKDVLSID